MKRARKKQYKAMAVVPCPVGPHTHHEPRAVTFSFDDEPTTIYDADDEDDGDGATSVGYTKTYARGWEAVFGKKEARKA